MSNNPSARDRQMFRPSEVSDCSARSELCIAAPTSLSKEHAKFFTGSVLLKGLLSQHGNQGDRINERFQQTSSVSTISDVVKQVTPTTTPTTTSTTTSTTNTPATTKTAFIAIPTPLTHDIAKVTCLFQASDYRQALNLLDQLAHKGPLPLPTRCAILLGRGLAYYKLDRPKEATPIFQELTGMAEVGGARSLAHIYLGDIACTRDSYGEAATHYEQAVAHHGQDGLGTLYAVQMPSLSHVCTKWGQALRKASKVMQAVGAFDKAVATAADMKEEMSARTSYGNMLQSLGNHQAAIDEYARTITLAEGLQDYVALGWNHGNIGNAYLGRGEKDKALHHLKRSLELTLVHETTPQAIGRAYNNIGTAYQAMGDLEKAAEHYALGLDQAIFGQDVPGQARAHGNLGNISMLKKEYDVAYQSYTETLNLSKDRSVMSTARHNRGCCLYDKAEGLRTGSPALPLSAEVLKLYEDGRRDFEEVVRYHEETLHTIKGSSHGLSLSAGLFDANSGTFQRLVDCLFGLGRSEEALVVAEQCRSRTLGELLLGRSARQLATPITYQQICSIVGSQEHTVVYLAYTGYRLIMWALTPHKDNNVTMAAVHIDVNKDQFNGKALDFHLRYDLPEAIADRDLELFGHRDYREKSPLHQLFEVVGKPLLKLIGGVHTGPGPQEIVLVPDSYTSMPMTALCDGTSFLGDHTSFRVMPSLLTMWTIDQSPSGKGLVQTERVNIHGDSDQFCIVGDPNIPPFTHNGEEVWLGRLPHASTEAQWVARTLGATATLGNQATKQAVLGMLQRAKVVHVATHGGAGSGFLAFSDGCGSSSTTPVEGKTVLLLPQEVEQLSISPLLVVLSSCNSARGRLSADGVVSMARAFLLAGAQSVLTTLWQVPDESAGVFMTFFYQYMVDGMTSTQALHKATLSVRFIKKYSKYAHWGAYQLLGKDVRFAPLPEKDYIIANHRGSTFPRLDVLTALETILLAETPTPLQIIHASPDLDPTESVLDFVHRHRDHFRAIVYVPGSCHELLEATEISLEKISPGITPDDSVLAVLHDVEDFSSLPHLLIQLLKRPTTSTIVIHTSPLPPTSIVKEIDSLLFRASHTHTLTPMGHTHCSQRMIHDILSRTDLVPMNREQEVMSLLCDLTRGSPILADLASEVVCAYSEGGSGDPMGRVLEEVVRPSSSGVGGGVNMAAFTAALIGALGLEGVELATLCSLAMYGPVPIPAAVATRVTSAIIVAMVPEGKHTADQVMQRLLKRRLVRGHPNMVLVPSGGGDGACLYQVPRPIIDGVVHGMEDVEIVLYTAVAHKAIQATPTMMTSLYHAALSRGLLQTVTGGGMGTLDVFEELYKPIASVLKRNDDQQRKGIPPPS